MPPSTVAGLVFLVAALSPGLVYHRMLTRFLPRDSRSTVVELVEMATAGALTSIVACVAVLGVAELVPALVSMDELTGDPAALRSHAWGVLLSTTLALAVSFGLAVLAGWSWVRKSGKAPSRIKEGSAWSGVLSRKRDGTPAFLAVELDDGRLVEGVFRTVSVAEDPARDALALRRPILVSGPGDAPRTEVADDFVLIPRSI
ncbi:MAG: DUF6338 family protein, partial [Umezawaea sp.]